MPVSLPLADTRGQEFVSVAISSLKPGESPRSQGQNREHIARLAAIEAPLPPILVNRRNMQVIDGTHRLLAAMLRGDETIRVIFFDGSPEEAFLCAVRANVAHGLPLSLADRQAAATRIVATHPHMSDRAIARVSGLGAKAVAAIRRRSTDAGQQLNTRIGRDGKVRPLNSAEGRRRAAEVMAAHPHASLREVARLAGISPATASDVRRRLRAGELPAPDRHAREGQARDGGGPDGGAPHGHALEGRTPDGGTPERHPLDGRAPQRPAQDGHTADRHGAGAAAAHGRTDEAEGRGGTAVADRATRRRHERLARLIQPDPGYVLEKLLRDPSLRHKEEGRQLLRLLQHNAIGRQEWSELTAAVPPHCGNLIVDLARQYAETWREFAQELDERVRSITGSAIGG
ncbi:hypothetical protein GCM10023237_14530 [Streptomyces coeruleoprunus]